METLPVLLFRVEFLETFRNMHRRLVITGLADEVGCFTRSCCSTYAAHYAVPVLSLRQLAWHMEGTVQTLQAVSEWPASFPAGLIFVVLDQLFDESSAILEMAERFHTGLDNLNVVKAVGVDDAHLEKPKKTSFLHHLQLFLRKAYDEHR